jgi:hypothetical protein
MVILQIDRDGISAVPSERDPPIPSDSDGPAWFALQRVPVEARQVDLFGSRRRSRATCGSPWRLTLATFGTLCPLGSLASKYSLSARLRKLRISGGNMLLRPGNVKSRFTVARRGNAGHKGGYAAGKRGNRRDFYDGKGKEQAPVGIYPIAVLGRGRRSNSMFRAPPPPSPSRCSPYFSGSQPSRPGHSRPVLWARNRVWDTLGIPSGN